MKVARNPSRVIHIVRQPVSLSKTSRALTSQSNIFETQDLERIKMLTFDKNYNYVGLKQVKEFMTKAKKGPLSRKQFMNSSLKSCTNKSNEQEDSYFTKQEVFKCFEKPENICGSRLMFSKKQEKTSLSSTSKHNQKYQQFLLSSFKRFDNYQQKIEKLRKYALKERKQNIASEHWNKVLRNKLQLSQIYKEQEENFEHIQRKGFKIKAHSKKQKQQEWLQRQNDSSLFSFIQGEKSLKITHERKKTGHNGIF